MSIPGSLIPLFNSGADGYKVERSLRFNTADSTRLARTFSTPTSQNVFTFSAWAKRTAFSNDYRLFGVGSSGNHLRFSSSEALVLTFGASAVFTSTRVFRDPGAWLHLVWSANGTSHQMYVNGVSIGSFTATNTAFNTAAEHQIGATNNSDNFSGYLAEIHFIDGQALTPSDFGETNATTGQWVPKAFSGGSYGTNGFYLKFADNSGTTSTTLGKDSSPNGNNWTPNNFSVTAGAGNDSLIDTPTSYGTDTGAGGEVRGNYCTLNPLTASAPFTLTNGSLDVSDNAASAPVLLGTIGVNSGKWYWEVTLGNQYAYVGAAQVTSRDSVAFLGGATGQFVYNTNQVSSSWVNGVQYNYSTASTATTGDVIGIALNFDSNVITFYKNGVSQGAFSSGILGTSTWAPAFKSNTATSASINFGQRPFAYTAPSGFKALCDTNLPAPTIAKPSTVMDTVLYTGTGSALTPTSTMLFSPDLVWIKGRSGATDNTLYDTVRGVEKRLESNNTDDEVTSDGGVTAFNSAGFTLGTLAQVNTNTATYAAWCWDESVSAGFDIVTYTGNGSARTISHGLGVAPNMIIVKARTTASTDQGWAVYHSANTTAPETDYLLLNSTAATADLDTVWNDTAPTSSVFSVGTNALVNANNDTYIAYCWAPVAGYSAFGSYTGNGSTDGPFVYLGFRPAVVIVKMSSSTGDWTILDDKREGYNVDNDPLYPNLASVEGTADLIDITSNGFKVRTTDATFNTNTGTYVYAAWASSPFAYARAR